MSIWKHSLSTRGLRGEIDTTFCPFCDEHLTELAYLGDVHEGPDGFTSDFRGSICDLCGWWLIKLYRHMDQHAVSRFYKSDDPSDQPNLVHQWLWTNASLKEFDLSDIAAPINEVQDFLTGRYHRRFEVHPKVMEDAIGDIFRNLGWDVVVTAYSSDGGVDAFITKDGQLCGVQVKRYASAIGVSQIREFSGALLSKRITRGVFVTTSRFTKGATEFREEVLPEQSIELLDADKLFDVLRITRRGKTAKLNEIFDDLGFETALKREGVGPELLTYFHAEQAFASQSLLWW